MQDEDVYIKDTKAVSQALTKKVSEMKAVMPYRTIKRGEPPIRPEPTLFSSSIEPQRKHSIIHALLVQTRMVIILMQPSRLSLPTTGFMLA